MPPRILVPIDDTPASRDCETLAVRIATVLGAELTLMHTVDTTSIRFKNIADMYVDMVASQAVNTAQAFIARRATEVGRMGVKPRVVTMTGEPAKQVCQEAARGYDFIMLGTRVHSDMSLMFRGSVTTELINSCHTPMLVVKQGWEGLARATDEKPLKVLLALDESQASSRCVDFFIALGAAGAIEVSAINVKPTDGIFRADPTNVLTEQVEKLKTAGYRTKLHMLEGEPGKVIAELGLKSGYDLLVAGKAKPEEMRERPVYSVGHYLYHHSAIPQMIVPFSEPRVDKQPRKGRT